MIYHSKRYSILYCMSFVTELTVNIYIKKGCCSDIYNSHHNIYRATTLNLYKRNEVYFFIYYKNKHGCRSF